MANNFRPPNRLARNPVTHLAHRRDVFWQIAMPLVVGVLILLAAAGAVAWAGTGGDVSRWANISIIWLILPVMFFSLVFLLLLLGLIYGLTRLLAVVPSFSLKVQDLFLIIKFRVIKLADRSVEPLLRIRQLEAALRTLLRRRKRA